jgi:hypothetical protein
VHGRAELRLAERVASWAARPENRQLPAAWEWANVRLFTRPRDWTAPQRQMMGRASRYHGLRAAVLLAVLALADWGAWEVNGRVRAAHLVDTLMAAETADAPTVIDQLGPYRPWAEPLLRQRAMAKGAGLKESLHLHLALLAWNGVTPNYLEDWLLEARPDEVPVIARALEPHGHLLAGRFRAVLRDDRTKGGRRLRVACALALIDPAGPFWEGVAGDLVRQLAAENPLVLPRWAESLCNVRSALVPPLVEQLVGADPGRFGSLVTLGRAYAAETVDLLHQRLGEPAPKEGSSREAFLKGQAQVAVALVRLDRPEKVWPLLRFPPDGDPTLWRNSPEPCDSGASTTWWYLP